MLFHQLRTNKAIFQLKSSQLKKIKILSPWNVTDSTRQQIKLKHNYLWKTLNSNNYLKNAVLMCLLIFCVMIDEYVVLTDWMNFLKSLRIRHENNVTWSDLKLAVRVLLTGRFIN